MKRVEVETRALPATVVGALASVGYRRDTVALEPAERVSVKSTPAFSGNRGFCVLLNLDTGERREHQGSWGGANPFEAHAVDHDDREHELPPSGAVIKGESGGRGAFARVYVHPSRLAPLLPSTDSQVSERGRKQLGIIKCLNSRGRAEYWERHPGRKPTASELETLERMGCVKVNRAGAVRLTAAGKTIADESASRAYGDDGWGDAEKPAEAGQ